MVGTWSGIENGMDRSGVLGCGRLYSMNLAVPEFEERGSGFPLDPSNLERLNQ